MESHGGGADHARWLAYTALVCAQAVRAYANRSLDKPVWRLTRNSFLLVACIAAVIIQAAIPFVGPLRDAFSATPLDAVDWTLAAVVAVAPAALAQAVRRFTSSAWVG
jgi:hypothetical protein